MTKGEATVTISADQKDFDSSAVLALREDLALALRAAALHGFAEGVCNHFNVELPDGSGRFLLNPRGLLPIELMRRPAHAAEHVGVNGRVAVALCQQLDHLATAGQTEA